MSSNDANRREYLSAHGVEKVLVAAVAQLLRERPEDAITALGKILQKPKHGFVSYTAWPPGMPRFFSHAAPLQAKTPQAGSGEGGLQNGTSQGR